MRKAELFAFFEMDDEADASFRAGMKATAPALGDDLDDWLPRFRQTAFDGAVLAAARNPDPVRAGKEAHARLKATGGEYLFSPSISRLRTLAARPAA